MFAWKSRVKSEPSVLATREQRVEAKDRLESCYAALNAKNAAVIDVLFVEAKESYAAARERLTSLDGKAATILGVVTTGFGAIALLGDPAKTPSRGGWMILALTALAIAFGLALYALMPQPTKYPVLSYYNFVGLLANPSNEPRLKYELTEAWLRDAQTCIVRGHQKSRFLVLAVAALAAALAALAVNYALAGEKPTPSVRVILESPLPHPTR